MIQAAVIPYHLPTITRKEKPMEGKDAVRESIVKMMDFAYAILLDRESAGGIALTMGAEIRRYGEKAIEALDGMEVSQSS